MPPISRASADHYIWGDRCDGWHLLRSPGLSVIEEHMPVGTAERRHKHTSARQFFYLLSGSLTVEVEGVPATLTPGSGLEIAPGQVHLVANPGPLPADFLVISQPPSHGDRTDL